MASELAQATAEALALVYIDCVADEGSYACAEAEGFIEISSRAVAEVLLLTFLCQVRPSRMHVFKGVEGPCVISSSLA